ncbi:MAG: hypothetical protein M4579_003510 [Chaenotheca gracillima]|nr:MAG: hypothetical protein M4579_003510 [Chaenotheca gracillima]
MGTQDRPDEVGRGEGNEGSPSTSPTDTRNSAVRYESIRNGSSPGDESPEQRRSSSVRTPAPQQTGGTYGSFTSHDGGPSQYVGQTVTSPRSMGPDSSSPGRDQGGPSTRQGPPTQERPSKIKKPGMSRRTSSTFQGPHRGQEFSVDDARNEVEQRLAQRQSGATASASGRGTVRRKPSTLRRRGTAPQSSLQTVESHEDEASGDETQNPSKDNQPGQYSDAEEGDEATAATDRVEDVEDEAEAEDDEDDDQDDLSDAESFTLRDKQNAINETHPFGVRIWKPALYKKNRSVEKTAEGDIHSSPGARVNKWLSLFNVLWTLFFGWWLAIVACLGALVCFVTAFAPGSLAYGRVLLGLAGYLFYPFGKFVKLQQDDAYAEEDEGEGRSISEYEQWQSGDLEDGRLFFGPISSRSLVGRRRNSVDSVSASESESLLGRSRRSHRHDSHGAKNKQRLFGRGEWNVGRVIFFVFFYGLITPSLMLASGFCWLMVFWIPMGRTTLLLFYHLRRHPLALSFHSDGAYSRGPGSPSSSILLCTYRAVGTKYWKYTIDGTNIFLINLLSIVVFAIFDYWVLDVALGLDIWLTHPALIFMLSLFSIIPLAYFIGQAVASISAQSSMGVGAAINAFFSTIVEVFLYCVALKEGKGQLVEGSIIGSIFAGILFLPGLSMCFGAIKRKTQRFNVKSAGVTSTMLLFAVIAAFGPTLFYQIYGTHELNCLSCVETNDHESSRDCRRCYFSQVPAVTDRFYIEAVRPYCWFAAVLLFMSYVIGLWFTLRTHAAVIWEVEVEEKKQQMSGHAEGGSIHSKLPNGGPPKGAKQPGSSYSSVQSSDVQSRANIRDSQLYKRILSQSLKQDGIKSRPNDLLRVDTQSSVPQSPHLVPPKDSNGESERAEPSGSMRIPGLSEEENQSVRREVVEAAAATATVAARESVRAPRKVSSTSGLSARAKKAPERKNTSGEDQDVPAGIGESPSHSGGHDAPNWSRTKSAVILLGATLLYAIIAEILVNTVDVVLESVDIDEKFLGITLFALVPNTTEFLVGALPE